MVFLHQHPDFSKLLQIVADEEGLHPILVEKDYWIMHCLWGLTADQWPFELKGGTSLSKGFGIIHRFSEDIDLRIEPREAGVSLPTGKNQDKPQHVQARRDFYQSLCHAIKIDGITHIASDEAFDDKKARSAGIRLTYPTSFQEISGIKEGILLEVGFDDTTPNEKRTISSWAWDKAVERQVEIRDNRAKDISCYAPEYTFVEKLQAISTKFRQMMQNGQCPSNFLRHYYDVYCLLNHDSVQKFVGTQAYEDRKSQRFPQADCRKISENPAFTFVDNDVCKRLDTQYRNTAALYFRGQPSFDQIIERIRANIERL